MAKRIDPLIAEVLDRYKIDARRALWDCHGTWIIYHKYVEQIGAQAGVKIESPHIVHADPDKKQVVICVTATLADRSEWSFGEAAPNNNKNAYPFAMAEKRAKDRVILKLVGLAGHVYTDQDVYEIKDGGVQWEAPAKAPAPKPDQDENKGNSSQPNHDRFQIFCNQIDEIEDEMDLEDLGKEIGKSELSSAYKGRLRKHYSQRMKEITNG